jgi:hypothetical protein
MTPTTARNRRATLFLIGGVVTASLIASFFQLFQPNKAEAMATIPSSAVQQYPSIASDPIPFPLPHWKQRELISALEKRNTSSTEAFNYNDYTYTAFWYRWTRVDGKLTTEPLERVGLSYETCVKSPYCNPDLEIGRTLKVKPQLID